MSLSAAILAYLAVLHTKVMQTIFETMALTSEQWLMILGISVLVIIGGEVDKILHRIKKSE